MVGGICLHNVAFTLWKAGSYATVHLTFVGAEVFIRSDSRTIVSQHLGIQNLGLQQAINSKNVLALFCAWKEVLLGDEGRLPRAISASSPLEI